jgi:transcription elongation GreA/GreB family factor
LPKATTKLVEESPYGKTVTRQACAMNKAFVREGDDERASNPLPDRPIPSDPNLVTTEGLPHIVEMVDLAQEQHTAAREGGNANEMARTERDLRYWMARQATAQVVKRGAPSERVEFGSSVTIRREDGRTQGFRIVGTDEADPAQGTLSYISPLAKALIGRSEGDTVKVGGGDAEILEIG